MIRRRERPFWPWSAPWLAASLAALCVLVDAAAAQDVTPPRLLAPVELTLPDGLEPLPEGAGVILLLTIREDGDVEDVVVDVGVRDDVDALALEAGQRLRFEPARRDGEPVAVRVRFRLELAPPRPPASDGSASDAPSDAAPSDAASDESEVAPNDASAPASDQLDDELDEQPVVAFGAQAQIERPEAGASTRLTLRGDELTTVPGTFGEPLRVVATLPGVTRSPFNLGFFLVRGASFENTGFFVDGFPVPLLYHLGAGPAVLNSRLVERLDFYPGGYPARFGRFSAGVISLETRAPAIESAHLELEVDLLKASALGVVPFDGGRGHITASYRRSYYELILPLLVDGVELSYSDWQLRLDWSPTSRATASLFYFGSTDRLDTSGALGAGMADEGTRSSLAYGFHRVIGKVRYQLPRSMVLTWSATAGVDRARVRDATPTGEDGLDLHTTYLGQRMELYIPVGRISRTTIGADVLASIYSARASLQIPTGLGQPERPGREPSADTPTLEPVLAGAAPYVEQTLELGPLELTGALRFDYLRYANVSRFFVDPRSVVRARLHPAVTLKAATGLFMQPPQPFQIAQPLGNPGLPPSRSWQSSGGLEVDLPSLLFVQTQAFYTRMYDLPVTSSSFFDPDNPLRRELYRAEGEGRAYGLEVLLRREAREGLYGWLSYTLAWSERFRENRPPVPFTFDQRHTLNLAVSYAWKKWRFGARFLVATGRPTRATLGCEEDLDGDRCVRIRGPREERLPTFHQLDIRIDRDFTINSWLRGSVYLDVLNVYNARNSEGFRYQWDTRARDRVPGLPTLGTIGIRLVFE